MRVSSDVSDYFFSIFDYSISLLDSLPISLVAQPISYVEEVLEAECQRRRPLETKRIHALPRAVHYVDADENRPIGMNTVGILTDRLTILAMKIWCLRRKHGKAEVAQGILDTEVRDVIAAIQQARPGNSTVLQKITELETDIHNADWAESYYGLMTSNLFMWEAQEAMYINNMADFDSDGVRAFLKWCSYGNLRRNRYITSCEVLYWQTNPKT